MTPALVELTIDDTGLFSDTRVILQKQVIVAVL